MLLSLNIRSINPGVRLKLEISSKKDSDSLHYLDYCSMSIYRAICKLQMRFFIMHGNLHTRGAIRKFVRGLPPPLTNKHVLILNF